jgi:hypothetical protein
MGGRESRGVEAVRKVPSSTRDERPVYNGAPRVEMPFWWREVLCPKTFAPSPPFVYALSPKASTARPPVAQQWVSAPRLELHRLRRIPRTMTRPYPTHLSPNLYQPPTSILIPVYCLHRWLFSQPSLPSLRPSAGYRTSGTDSQCHPFCQVHRLRDRL